ncbi:plasmid replication initiator [Siccirubricoccus sp. KC 17139]|uniref:Plasmid replication initiator n=1 Tax=Siccirubricoccus soli TaxID=2899147 RepID=A0ABT1DCX8_9PROT|nr:replication protein RepA [Siccirubricoccus soli]MCO6419795.1 plasmid replication initiator [Siccirubricoccus soli]MCP2685930.1 replication protein RepA [Siccirubricoccus soli]
MTGSVLDRTEPVMGTVHDLLETKGKQAALQAGLGRDLVEAAAAYMGDEDGALSFVYSGWAQCALPHRRLPDDQAWEIAAERVRLVVEPGRRPRHGDGPLEFLGVPFGSHARLILLYLQTEALRTGSREVELGRSLRDWMGRIGVSVGGRTGMLVKDQAERISRCRLTFHLQGGKSAGLINQSIVDRALFIEDEQAGQGRLSLETAKLSEGFFEQLRRHPVPLEEAAIRALSNNPAALDTYLWLAYRLHALAGPKLVPWPALKGQFGAGYRELYHFKNKWTGALQMALAVYPAAKVEVVDDGVVLKPSRPPVLPKVVAIR